MSDHAEDRRVEAERSERRDAEHHEAHVSHRAERNEALHVGLSQTAKRTIDNADDGEAADPRSPRFSGHGQDRDGNTHEAVGTELQQNCSKDDRALSRRLGMSIGQPCVEWEHRHLDRKSDEHASEDPDLNRPTKQTAVFGEICNVEARFACGHLARHLKVERQEGNEHQRRTEHRVQEELERGVLAILATPDTDHEVHRQEHEFEEHEEQDEVLRHEGSGHANLQYEHQDEERLGITRRRDVVP